MMTLKASNSILVIAAAVFSFSLIYANNLILFGSSGDSSAESSLCSTYSMWADSMENCVDIDVVSDDLCDAYKSESADRYGSS